MLSMVISSSLFDSEDGLALDIDEAPIARLLGAAHDV
jgi:hypothetical protein